jgi:hypothetical protein
MICSLIATSALLAGHAAQPSVSMSAHATWRIGLLFDPWCGEQ